MEATAHFIPVNPRRFTRMLWWTAQFLVIAHIVAMTFKYQTLHPWKQWINLFDLNEEKNIPTFFSCFLLMTASLLLATISKSELPAARWSWRLLSWGFFAMSLDEFIGIHEKLAGPFRNFFQISGGIFYFAWTLPAVLLVFTLGLVLFRFFMRLPTATRFWFGLSAVLYLGGAIGFELLGSALFQPGIKLQSLSFVWACTLEESLEMAGAILFIDSLLVYLASRHEVVGIRFIK